jgi:hypothetical protein
MTQEMECARNRKGYCMDRTQFQVGNVIFLKKKKKKKKGRKKGRKKERIKVVEKCVIARSNKIKVGNEYRKPRIMSQPDKYSTKTTINS